MKITAVDCFHVRVPVRPLSEGGIAPYRGARDAVGVETAGSLLVAVRTDEDLTGWGEMNTGFEPAVDRSLVRDWIGPALLGADPALIRAAVDRLDKPYWPQLGRRALASAVEMALWDLLGRSLGVPVATLLGGRRRSTVPMAFCLGITSVEDAVATAIRIADEGYQVLKTKIGLDLPGDLERVRAVVDATGGRLRLRLDANQAYDRTAAIRLLDALAGLPIEYVEQPLPVGDLAGMRSLVGRGRVPIAINEDAYVPGGVARAIRDEAADAAVVDLEAAGGVAGLIDLAGLASSFGLPLAHHCGWDLGVKAGLMLQVVSVLPAFVLASDSTYPMHSDDVLTERLRNEGGELVVPTGPGLGVEVDEAAVTRLAVP